MDQNSEMDESIITGMFEQGVGLTRHHCLAQESERFQEWFSGKKAQVVILIS